MKQNTFYNIIILSLALLSACTNGSNARFVAKNNVLNAQKNSGIKLNTISAMPQLGDPAMITLHSFQPGGTQCVYLPSDKTVWENVGGGLYFTSQAATSQLKSIVGVSGGVKLQQLDLNANAAITILDGLYNDSKNINLVYMAEQHGKVKSTALSGRSVSLTPVATSIIEDGLAQEYNADGTDKHLSQSQIDEIEKQISQKLRQTCGDGAVTSYTAMVMLLAKVNLHFDSVADQRTLSAKVDIEGGQAANLLGDIQDVATKNHLSGTVNIELTQLGGHPDELFRALSKYGVDTELVKCSLSDTTPCKNIIRAMIDYSTNDLKDQIGKNGTALSYFTVGDPGLSSYTQLGYDNDEYGIGTFYSNKKFTEVNTFNMSNDVLPYAKYFVNNVTNDATIVGNYLSQYDNDVIQNSSTLRKLDGIRVVLKNLNDVLINGKNTIANANGYGKITNVSGDTLNSACFYPGAIYPYEQLSINTTKLKNIQAQINASGIDKTSQLLGSRCGQYLVTILSQIKTASNGLLEPNFKHGYEYSNTFLTTLQQVPIMVGGEYAKYLNDQLYLIPDYGSNNPVPVYHLVGGDNGDSDTIRDSKFLVDIDGAEAKSTIKLAGIIKEVTIKKFPVAINATPFLGKSFFPYNNGRFTLDSAYKPLSAQNLVIAPLYSDSEGCVKYDEMEAGNTYRCTGRHALGVTPLQANENNTAAAAFYDLMFRHIELNNYEAYSLNRLNTALTQLHIEDFSADNILAQKLKCVSPNLVLLSKYSGKLPQLECVTPSDYKNKFAAPSCRYDQLAYKDFQMHELSGCYPQEKVQALNSFRDGIFTALTNLGVYPKFVTVDEELNHQASCSYPNQSVLYIWGQPTVSKVEFKCQNTTEQQNLGIPRCNSAQVSAYVAKDTNGNGASFSCYPKNGDQISSEQEYFENIFFAGYEQLNKELGGKLTNTLSLSKENLLSEFKNCHAPKQLNITYVRNIAAYNTSMGYADCLTLEELKTQSLPPCNIKNRVTFSVDGTDMNNYTRTRKIACY